MSVYKRGRVWHYRFCIRGLLYRKSIPEARTKYQAEQAEVKAKDDVFNARYGKSLSNITLRDFVETTFLPWSRDNKRSWKNDESRSKPILSFFKNRKMREITRLEVEQFKKVRKASFNGRGKLRAPASIDRELQLLSRIYSLAIERGLVETNPCRGVKLSAIGSNLVPRYLKLEEQQRLMPFLTGRRAHVASILIISQYTGMRRTEILTLNKNQIDFFRDLIELRNTKSGKPRSVPVHRDIKPLLQDLSHRAGPSGYLFENPKTGRPLVDIKTAWRLALRDAGIPHIPFHCAGRHTFGTRAVDGGAPLSAVRDVMGHVDIRTTMRYVHGTDEGKRRAVEAAAIAVGTSSTNMAHANELTAKREM